MGFISLKGVEIHGKIGVSAEERLIGRKFIVDIRVKSSLKKMSQTDKIEDGFNYEILSEAINNCFKKEYKLMEAACKAITEDVLKKEPGIEEIVINIQKINPFIKGKIEVSVVEWHYPEDY